MYYPIQIPYTLSESFRGAVSYTEDTDPRSSDFVICLWEMQPLSEEETSVTNVIVMDGCIDLVVHFDAGRIGFSGMSKTEFDYRLDLPTRCFGARMKPGAFHQLFGLPASSAMDHFLPVNDADKDFDCGSFFSLPFSEAKAYFRNYLAEKSEGIVPNLFVGLFDELSDSPPETVATLYDRLHYSPRQCQRLFAENYGFSPQATLSILRFQLCLKVLTSGAASPGDILGITSYYDQAHFINDFKRNIGLTPFELIRQYKA